MLQDWSASTSSGSRFDSSGDPKVLDNQLYTRHPPGSHTLQTRLLQQPVVRSSDPTHCSVNWMMLCVQPLGSYFNHSTETTSAIRCRINFIGWMLHQTVHPGVLLSKSYLVRCCIPVSSRSIVFAFYCFGWLSRTWVCHSDSRSTCVCCILTGLLELPPSQYLGTWNQSGDFQKETKLFCSLMCFRITYC